ncbi:ATP-binding protein [candidate division KSB1 bacterium]|nr:ATP-binding protein [candidate division KSB1 bacterium]
MLNRKILLNLRQWKNNSSRKPLVLRGARQVGKTTAVEIFSKEFENYIYLNLELKGDRDIFDEALSIDEIFQAILVIKNIHLKKGKTLLFIDEIQNSPVAVKMLRYFYEKRKELFVIAAGSLFELMLEKSQISFPVGRVQFFYMYPLTFEEFLQANREDQLLEAYRATPVKSFAVQKLFDYFHRYTMIGGMPEIVKQFSENNNVPALKTQYESLLTSYLDDADKYARNPTMRQVLRHCIESIPFEAGKRIKFQGFGSSNHRSREVGEALRTIERAMLIYLIYPSTSLQLPIMADYKKSPKLQFVDTGLLNYFVGLQPVFFQYADLHSFYKGLIAEHIVRQELIAQDAEDNKKILFWVREKKQSNAEIDILLPYKNHVIPVEVKSGKTGALRSLHQFVNESAHPYAVRLCEGNFEIINAQTPEGKTYKLLNLPYFLAGRIHDYLKLLVN